MDSVDPKSYVDALLDVHKKNSETVMRSFRGEAGFVASLDKACREFVNRNAAKGQSNAKSPELLAKHADLLLRKSNKLTEEDDLEVALNRVVSLPSLPLFYLMTFLFSLNRWFCSSILRIRMYSRRFIRRSCRSGLYTVCLRQTRARRV